MSFSLGGEVPLQAGDGVSGSLGWGWRLPAHCGVVSLAFAARGFGRAAHRALRRPGSAATGRSTLEFRDSRNGPFARDSRNATPLLETLAMRPLCSRVVNFRRFANDESLAVDKVARLRLAQPRALDAQKPQARTHTRHKPNAEKTVRAQDQPR